MADFSCPQCEKVFKHKHHFKRHFFNHTDKKYSCGNCSAQFYRMDRKQRHEKKCKEKTKTPSTCELCSKVLSNNWNLTRHKEKCELRYLKIEMRKKTDEYKRRLKEGAMIEHILRTCPDTMEEALCLDKRHCLKLYQYSQAEGANTDDVTLKPWQKQVMAFVEDPSERTIYWIVGKAGNEGKTFIQKHIYGVYGSRRVIKSELNVRKNDIAYTFSQEALTCKDIFLFNLLRSDWNATYGILENIKDGYLISSKYRSIDLKIKTPNTVIVFSNTFPDANKLSKDRWSVYEITCSGNLVKRSV